MDCSISSAGCRVSDAIDDDLIASTSSSLSNAVCRNAYNGPSMDCFWRGLKANGEGRLVVVGHRGCGKNRKPLSLSATKTFMSFDLHNDCHIDSSSLPLSLVMENTVMSFNAAAVQGAHFVEFDVQVTKDGCPVVFHDDLIVFETEGSLVTVPISDLSSEEFCAIGYQGYASKMIKKLLRKAVDGSYGVWTAPIQDKLCTLQHVFEQVTPSVGFNIELKFHDTDDVPAEELHRVIDATLNIVEKCKNGRRIYFSSFHPDAVELLRKKQSVYPVLFLTDGGVHLYKDPRRNSLEKAVEICRNGGLQGIVSELRAILKNPEMVSLVHEAGLCMLTYGDMNNLAEVVHKQQEIGVDGVVVDNVADIVRVNKALDMAQLNFEEQSALDEKPSLAPRMLKAVRAYDTTRQVKVQ